VCKGTLNCWTCLDPLAQKESSILLCKLHDIELACLTHQNPEIWRAEAAPCCCCCAQPKCSPFFALCFFTRKGEECVSLHESALLQCNFGFLSVLKKGSPCPYHDTECYVFFHTKGTRILRSLLVMCKGGHHHDCPTQLLRAIFTFSRKFHGIGLCHQDAYSSRSRQTLSPCRYIYII